MKKILCAVLVLTTVVSAIGGIAVFADFGSGISVVAEGEELIKTGLYGKKLAFSDTDFKQGLAISDFDSIKITKLPPSSEGTLMLGGRRVGEGNTIRRKNIGALVFIPASKDVAESKFMFTITPYADSNEIEFTLKFTDKINYEPKIDEASPTSIITQRDVAIFGRMSANDAEGDKIKYIVVSYPEYGTLEITNEETGEFRYTPTLKYVGEDSFSYVARDEWGNYSTLATMSVNVSERMTEIEYEDMRGTAEYNAALTLSAMGVMNGKILGDGVYFMPEENVSKAEFVAMLMKTVGVKADSTITETYFDDNEKIPVALRSYVGTAQRAGYVIGEFDEGKLLFNPNEAITSYEAASIIKRILGEKADMEIPVFKYESDLPVWAKESLYVVCALGIFDGEASDFKADDLMTKKDCAACLYKLLNM